MARRKAAMKKLGFLSSAASPRELADPVAAFRSGMKSGGFVEGENVKVIYQWAKHDLSQLPDLARKLVDAEVDVLAATGGLASAQAAVEAAKKSAKRVRVVFVGGFDPVKAKLVDNVDRPSGDATGVTTSTTECLQERLQLAKKLLGEAIIAVLVKPNSVLGVLEAERAGGAPVLKASTEDELKARFAEAKKKRYAVLIGADAFFTSKRKQIVALAKLHGVSVIYPFRDYVEAGGLMSYGPSLPNAYRRAGVYVGQILGDLDCANPPVIHPSLEHAINLKTAKALGVKFPHELLARATNIIE
jgi:putative ABC transport system substrate-binding protein